VGGDINCKLALQRLGPRRFRVLETLDRHYVDEGGRARWREEEWPEIEREIDRELGEAAGRDGPWPTEVR
jgi:hypothetical protein